MAKKTFPVATTTNYLSTFNQNFADVATILQDQVLYRDNPPGEPNTMENDLDMNGHRIFNLPEPALLNEAARLQDVVNAVAGIVPASGIPFVPSGTISSTNVQAAIQELDADIVAASAASAANLNAHILDPVDAHLASAIGFTQAGTGAISRTLLDKSRETVSAKDFGLSPSNTDVQNDAAMVLIVNYAISQNGLTVFIPRGVYNFTTINLTGANNFRLTGEGIDATVLRTTSATANFITTGATIYQTIDNLTVSSVPTRTAGSMITTGGFWKRGLIFRVKVERHFNGINMFQFEHCTLMEVNIVTPTGNGSALIVGNPAVSNQGANLNLVTVFIRGNDESNPVSAAVGRWGIYAYDIEAIYGINVDLSVFTDQAMVIEPTFQIANCFFTSCYFDATVGGDNILVRGAGIKNRFQFSNCWFASAGRYGAGAANQSGVQFQNAGTYIDWKFVGCQFVGTSGPGLIVLNADADITVSGCSFNNCGTNTSLPTTIYLQPAATQTSPMVVSGCKFIPFGSSTSDFNISTNGRGNVITGNQLLRGITYAGGAQFGNVSGNSDPNTSNSVASAATLQVPSTKKHLFVTGTTNVGGIFRTYTDHEISLTVVTGFTFLNGGALVLRGAVNFVAVAGNVLNLVCKADGNWQEVSRSV